MPLFFASLWSQEILRRIWGLHGGDYEERRLLGYKNPVRTSQEKHYLYATEPSRLMLCKILRFSRRWLWRMLSSGIYKTSSYFTGDTLRLRYGSHPVNVMYDLTFSRWWLWRMSSSGTWCSVGLFRTDVSEDVTRGIFPPWRWMRHVYPKRRF
jgi:hypothetical protein